MKRVLCWVLVLACVLVLAPPAGTSLAAESRYRTGCLPSDPEVLRQHLDPDYRSRLQAMVLPPSVDWSSGMPPAGDQGQQGSCVAWATGYALKTYQENVERQWGVDTPAHQFSPAYIYNQINGGVDAGSRIPDALNLLVEEGCDTLDSFPYNEWDYLTQPTEEQRRRAYHFRADGWAVVDLDPTPSDNSQPDIDVELLKVALQDGPVVIGANVYYEAGWDGWLSPGPEGEINRKNIAWWRFFVGPDGGHAVCVVGYDDNHHTVDGPGAFKFINSWGPEWGYGGYGWMSYEYVRYEVLQAEQVRDLTMELSLGTAEVRQKAGGKQQLKAVARYSNGQEEDVTGVAEWSSSDPSVARVERGLVTGIAAGRAVVTASYGFKDASCAVTVEALVPPRGLKARTSTRGVLLEWEPPPGDVAPSHYAVEAAEVSSGPWAPVKEVSSWEGPLPSCEVTAADLEAGGLAFQAGRKYWFRVRAVYGAGSEAVVSPYSNVAYATAGPLPPEPPASLKARTASDGVLLQWQPPRKGVVPEGYEVHVAEDRSGPFVPVKDVTEWEGEAPNAAVTLSDCAAAGLEMVAGTKYYFQVHSFILDPVRGGRIRSLQPATAYATAGPEPPSAPSGLKARTAEDGVVLEWRAPSSGPEPAGYRVEVGVERSGDFAFVKEVETLGCEVTGAECEAAGLPVEAGRRYYFQVRSFIFHPVTQEKILSPKGATAYAVAGPQPPSAPVGLKGATAADGVVLSWKVPRSGVRPAGYEVEIAAQSGGDYVLVQEVQAPEGDSVSCEVTMADCAERGFDMVAGSKYYFRVYSYAVHSRTGERIRSAKAASTYAVAGPEAPGAPVGLKGKAAPQGVVLEWRLPRTGTPPAGFEVYAGGSSTGPFAPLTEVDTWEGDTVTCPIGPEEFAEAGLTLQPGVKYYFRVQSFAVHPQTGERIRSAKAATTSAKAGPEPPYAPSGLKGASVEGGVLLTWRAPTRGAQPEGYLVYVGASSSDDHTLVKEVTDWEGETPSCVVTVEECRKAGYDMVPGTRSYFRVYSYITVLWTGEKLLSLRAATVSATAGGAAE